MFDLLDFEMKQWPMWSFDFVNITKPRPTTEQFFKSSSEIHFLFQDTFLLQAYLSNFFFCCFLYEYHVVFSTSFLTVVFLVAKGPSGAAGRGPGLELE